MKIMRIIILMIMFGFGVFGCKYRNHQSNNMAYNEFQTDQEMATRIIHSFENGKESNIWDASEYLKQDGIPVDQSIIPGLNWIILNTEDSLLFNGESSLPKWVWAAWVLGAVGTESDGEIIKIRLSDPYASSFWVVNSCSKLEVHEIIPLIIEALHNDRSWDVNSQAWGSSANYLLGALEELSKKSFTDSAAYSLNIDDSFRNDVMKRIEEWKSKEGRIYFDKMK